MGRMFEILKQTDADGAAAPPTIPFTEPSLTTRVVAAVQRDPVPEPEPEDDEEDGEGEIPFIEVGPHKSMEASASVLAAAPLKTNLPKVQFDEPPLVPPEDAAGPRPVVFRPVSPEVLRRRRHSKIATEIIAFHDPDHAVSAQYHDLFTAMTAVLPPGRPHALLFMSALAETATTDVLLNVAVTAARIGRRRVAVLDANLKNPGIAQRLGLSDDPGLRQILAGTSSPEEALQQTEQENLFAVTAGADQRAGSLRLVAETLRSVVRNLRQRFDLVFVDGPTWDGKTEALQAAVACDVAYLVLPQQEADSPRVDELFQALPDKGVCLAGCIFVGQ
jgi:Mrp family chromosome partitioning ATPase